MPKNSKNPYKKFVLSVLGCFFLVSGITLILVFWPDVVVLFRGAGGIIFALVGLFLLYAVSL